MKSIKVIKKPLLIILLMATAPAHAGWMPQWLSTMCPTFNTKNTAYLTVGAFTAAGIAYGGYLYYKHYYAPKSPALHQNQRNPKALTHQSPLLPFKEWKDLCTELPDYELPDYRAPIQNLDDEKEKEKEDDEQPTQTNYYDARNDRTALSAQNLDIALKNYFNSIDADNDFFKNPAHWVNNEMPEDLFRSLKRNNQPVFDPYVQKVVVANDAVIAFHGDIHGDIKSLNLFLSKLHNDGYLNNFKINNPHFYMVFLGDYTDRGWYGAEVIYTILQLKCANPNQVFLVRGNHEDKNQNDPEFVHPSNTNNFYSQLKAKFPDNAEYLFEKIQKMYETLPLALYLGSGNGEQTDFILCCHGGVEIGFNPHDLLNHGQPVAYTKLGSLNRFKPIERLQENECGHILNLFKRANPKIKNYIELQQTIIGDAGGLSDHYLVEFIPEGIVSLKKFPTNNNRYATLFIGFQWNDYEVDSSHEELKLKPWFVKNAPGRGWKIGKTFNHATLKLHSDERNTIHGVFRAHQHSASPYDPMMQRILNTDGKDHDVNCGVGKLWTEQKENHDDPHTLHDNIVCTFNVCPHTPYQTAGFNFDTYGLLYVAESYADWRLEVVQQVTQ